MNGSLVADIVVGGIDSAGKTIATVYAKVSGTYAIYQTDERVVVQFADNEDLGERQRKSFARINPIKGEINGLIDGWRSSTAPDKQTKASCFDRRVADALCAGFQGNFACAQMLLHAIKRDLIEERTSWARFEYLIMASAAAAALIAILSVLTSDWYRQVYHFSPQMLALWSAAAVGTLGAFFSIAIAIRSRSVLTDLHSRDNAADAILRIVIGAIAAALLVCLIQSNLITLSLSGRALALGTDSGTWMLTVVVAFLAGFSERLVPDLLEKSAPGGEDEPPAQRPAVAALNGAGNGAAPPRRAGEDCADERVRPGAGGEDGRTPVRV